MFRSLRVRNYRLYAGGQLISLTGTWMQRVAQDWLVLEPDELRHRARRRHRAAVRPGAAARAVGRRHRRPRQQAPHPVRHPGRAGAGRARARPARRRRGGAVLARAGARARARRRLGDRHAGPPVVRRRDGRPRRSDQRGRHQLDDLQQRPHPRSGRRRRDDQCGRHRLGVPRRTRCRASRCWVRCTRCVRASCTRRRGSPAREGSVARRIPVRPQPRPTSSSPWS